MQIPSVDEHMNHVRPIHVQARAYCTKDVSVRTMDAIKNIVVVYRSNSSRQATDTPFQGFLIGVSSSHMLHTHYQSVYLLHQAQVTSSSCSRYQIYYQ